jgi:hypothetical protein
VVCLRGLGLGVGRSLKNIRQINNKGDIMYLRKEFEEETGEEAIYNFTSCYSAESVVNIDYVKWLENKINTFYSK